jgi:hypothetical protein
MFKSQTFQDINTINDEYYTLKLAYLLVSRVFAENCRIHHCRRYSSSSSTSFPFLGFTFVLQSNTKDPVCNLSTTHFNSKNNSALQYNTAPSNNYTLILSNLKLSLNHFHISTTVYPCSLRYRSGPSKCLVV